MKLMAASVLLFLAISITQASTSLFNSNDSLVTQLDALFGDQFTADEPGGSILIQKGEKTIYLRSYGVADMITKEKITKNTIFNTGSISKTFVANGILVLKEKGLLSLEDNLAKYFDDFQDKEIAKSVKIKHLLSHTSGLPDLRDVGANKNFYLTAKDKENFAPLKKTTALNFTQGSQFQYSNPAYNGLALIIEKVTKQSWQNFIKENIFKLAGMTNSKITDGDHPKTGVAHAYDWSDGKYVENDYGEFPTFAAAGNGGVWSTVLDLAKYEKALQQNTFLNQSTLTASRTPFYPKNWRGKNAPFIGYGWFLGKNQFLGSQNNFGVDIVYHTGSQGGFRAFYISIPEKDILFIGLFNRPLHNFGKLIIETMRLLQQHNWIE